MTASTERVVFPTIPICPMRVQPFHFVSRVFDRDRGVLASIRRHRQHYIKRSISFPALLNEVKILTLLITQERAYKKSKIFMFLSSDFNLSTFD